MVVTFNNVDPCEVDLLQTEFVKIWCELHVENSGQCPYWTRVSTLAYHTYIDNQLFDDSYHREPDTINEEIEKLQQLTGYDWPVRAYSGMGFDVCNLIHRMFTTSLASRKTPIITERARDLIFQHKQKQMPLEHYWNETLRDPKFLLDQHYPIIEYNTPEMHQFVDILESINSAVHRYEDRCLYSDRGASIAKQLPYCHENLDVDWDRNTLDGREVNKIKYIPRDGYDDVLMEAYGKDMDCDVYHIKCIRGKSYMLAYQQYDDPRHWDITRTSHVNGGFTLDPFHNTNELYNSGKFRSWLDDYNHSHDPKLFGHLQIGKISNGWKENLKINKLYNEMKPISEAPTNMQSELIRSCSDYQVTGVEFYK